MLQTWDMLVFVARLRKKKLFYGELQRKVLRKQSYKIKIFNHSVSSFQQPSITKRRQIEARIYGCRIIKRKSIFFSKQLGINCTCEQIKLFLISTRGCGSHSLKLLKSPICSRVQLIPNCFSNRSISYTNTFCSPPETSHLFNALATSIS